MRSYEEITAFLFEQFPMFQKYGKTAFKPGLENITDLLSILDNPHNKIKTIHVGGTNGKGSCSHLLSAILQNNGYKVGLYTSPHLVDFRERIKINGQLISKQTVIDFVERNDESFKDIRPSFFEWSVALALDIFEKEKVDVAIIEVGMGGRLDSTNIITPLLSLITNIGFDHVQYLGNTYTAIAGEKAGIIKSDIPIVIGEYNKETKPVFENKANEVSTEITFAQDYINAELVDKSIDQIQVHTNVKDFENLQSDLAGDYQVHNIRSILACLPIIQKHFVLDSMKVKEGIEHAKRISGFGGRWDVLSKSPLIICDTGHNVEGIQYNLQRLSEVSFDQLHFVFGVVSDKDINGVLDILPKEATYYICQANIKRALDIEQLGKHFRNKELNHSIHQDVASAYDSAIKNAKQNDIVFIGGSTFVVGDFLLHYNQENDQ